MQKSELAWCCTYCPRTLGIDRYSFIRTSEIMKHLVTVLFFSPPWPCQVVLALSVPVCQLQLLSLCQQVFFQCFKPQTWQKENKKNKKAAINTMKYPMFAIESILEGKGRESVLVKTVLADCASRSVWHRHTPFPAPLGDYSIACLFF